MAYQFQPGQLAFIQRLSADTGLDRNVVAAWVYNEENGSSAAGRQAQGNHNWLNIGVTDSGTYGSGFPSWRNPITAADATAAWMKGTLSIPGFGKASAGIQRIPQTAASHDPSLQIMQIQQSGWASGGEAAMRSLYEGISGHGLSTITGSTGIDTVVKAPFDAAMSVTHFLGRLTDPSYILRGLQIVAGAVLVLVGVFLLARQVALAADIPDPIKAAPGVKAANALT